MALQTSCFGSMPTGVAPPMAESCHLRCARIRDVFSFKMEAAISVFNLQCLFSGRAQRRRLDLNFNGAPIWKISCRGTHFFDLNLSNLYRNWKPTESGKQRQPQRIYCCWSEAASEDEAESTPQHIASERWDVLGLGQAMVDFSGMVEDGFLEKLGLKKGIRKVVNHEERGRILRAMDGCSFKAAAGGSLSNTLVALARLGTAKNGVPALRVAMAGSVGSDALGDFYRAKLQRANVSFLSLPVKDGTTGTVIVLTTPDAQRTMLPYQGMPTIINFDSSLANIISKSRILVVEGYLWEFPQTIEAIAHACETAHRSGVLVAITASDVSCVTKHRKQFCDIIGDYADVVFANSDEARAFCVFSSRETPALAARYMSHYSPLISVTDGAKGSYIAVKGEVIYIPPASCIPVDTCGAGDAYAAGILYEILRGTSDLKGIGNLAARVAAVVVGQRGTRLKNQDANELTELFCHASFAEGKNSHTSGIFLDMGSDQISNV